MHGVNKSVANPTPSKIQAGWHVLAELAYDRDWDDRFEAQLMRVFEQSLKEADLVVLKTLQHAFEPYGSTGLALLAESHASYHTWPEYKTLAIDIFSCNSRPKAENCLRLFIEYSGCRLLHTKTVRRDYANPVNLESIGEKSCVSGSSS